jgi:hypothetical protein
MGNLLQYADKSKTIDERIKTMLSKIEYDYQHGNIRTQTEYYYRIKNMIADLYKNLTKPTFKFRPAVSTPRSDEYNSMISEGYYDMEFVIKDCESLSKMIESSFIDATLARNMMSNEVEYLSRKISTIGQSISKYEKPGTVVFTELFENKEQTYNASAKNACTVNVQDGILTLREKTHSTNQITKVNIDSEKSNGFPGNTHCVDSINSEVHFLGQDGIHTDPKAIFDNNTDTWFEFELFAIDDKIRKECNSLGFNFDEGVMWINNEDILRLKLTVTLAEEAVCSWVSITPYLSDVKGLHPAILEKCDVITLAGTTARVAEGVGFDGTLTFAFPPQPVHQIEFTFIQPVKYLCKVGHFTFTSANTTSMSIFQDFEKADIYSRVEGKMPSVSMLGVKYDPTTKWLNYSDSSISVPSDEYAKANLFTCPESTAEKKASIEIIDAYRYLIGIREITVTSVTFEDTSEYVSIPFTTEDVITSVALTANEYTPGGDPDVIRYFISVDGGTSWHRIYPAQRSYQGVYKYYINNDNIENLLQSNNDKRRAQNLSIMGNPKSVQLKIEMDKVRDAGNVNYATPIVYDYKLKVTTGGDTIEY